MQRGPDDSRSRSASPVEVRCWRPGTAGYAAASRPVDNSVANHGNARELASRVHGVPGTGESEQTGARMCSVTQVRADSARSERNPLHGVGAATSRRTHWRGRRTTRCRRANAHVEAWTRRSPPRSATFPSSRPTGRPEGEIVTGAAAGRREVPFASRHGRAAAARPQRSAPPLRPRRPALGLEAWMASPSVPATAASPPPCRPRARLMRAGTLPPASPPGRWSCPFLQPRRHRAQTTRRVRLDRSGADAERLGDLRPRSRRPSSAAPAPPAACAGARARPPRPSRARGARGRSARPGRRRAPAGCAVAPARPAGGAAGCGCRSRRWSAGRRRPRPSGGRAATAARAPRTRPSPRPRRPSGRRAGAGPTARGGRSAARRALRRPTGTQSARPRRATAAPVATRSPPTPTRTGERS